MGKIGITELILIVGVALLIFGPAKLPELGKAVGKSIREFKGALSQTAEEATKAASTEVKAAAAEPAQPKN